MQITPLLLILAAIIGLLIGLLVASLFPSRENKGSRVITETPPDLAKDGFAEAARLWYSPDGKKIITELDGGFYRDYETLSAEQKARVDKYVEGWNNWAGKTIEPVPAVRYVPGMPDLPARKEQQASTPQPLLGWSLKEAIKEVEENVQVEQAIEVAPKTIAGQISDIIDKMLEGNPLREKGIKLIENSSHGVDVWIGLEKFDGIDAIPYPEVKSLIRQAVAQWERESENPQLKK